jgi:hypothetical protein
MSGKAGRKRNIQWNLRNKAPVVLQGENAFDLAHTALSSPSIRDYLAKCKGASKTVKFGGI